MTKPPRIASFVLMTSIALCLGCSILNDSMNPDGPDQHTLRGHVVLTGYLVNAQGQFAGTRVMGDADGVPVELVRNGQVVATTTTIDGVYRFGGLASGSYIARVTVIGDIGDQTAPLTIAGFDLASADTLKLASRGDLFPVPNPFSTGLSVYYVLGDSADVDIQVLDIGGSMVRRLLRDRLPGGQHEVVWNGLDQAGQAVPAGFYWVTLAASVDVRAQLLFK